MELKGNKIIFKEDDLKVLSKFKEMGLCVEEIKKLNIRAAILKKQAYGEIEMFCYDNNIEWNNMSFDQENNSLTLSNKNDNSGDIGGFLERMFGGGND